ncbi:AraC-like DNA-binding protein [Chitinophaga polysaccharea]|uniref:AraC-like DNA-binding protein n=1 Tax=Chitinophaga polysaccharea TaxID=1293035 RepID=A0A561P671_9BACT|nr:helix-turn-helix domain-containing protein [Chitinophaga polysaccharea]TWF33609.1 AraC-like DNA-binding protein [Chitinophaga polysaccharea]
MRKNKQHVIASYRLEDLLIDPGLLIDVHYKATGEISHAPHADLNKAHRHEFYTLIVARKQRSQHMVDFQQVVLPPESVFLLSPWQVHMPGDIETTEDLFLISFMPDFIPADISISPFTMKEAIIPPTVAFNEIWHLCEVLQLEVSHRCAQQEQLLQHYLAILLIKFMRCLPDQSTSNTPPPALLTRYRELMEVHLRRWISPADYADALHVSAGYLNEVVKQETGQTASALLAARRVLEAKRMLLHSALGIKEIAWHLRFNEVTYFNRFFKKHTHQTPMAFRITSREKYNYNPE